MRLKFIADAYYNNELIYKTNEICEVSNELGFAMRWIKRGLAIEVAEPLVEPLIEFEKKESKDIIEETIQEVVAPKVTEEVAVPRRRTKR
jgi:hypothetical protein